MSTWRQALIVFTIAMSSACSLPPALFDSCGQIREFTHLNWRLSTYAELPVIEVTSLPPQVTAAVTAFSHRVSGGDAYFILSARKKEPHILLEITGACFDCKRWVVYSPTRQCIVGTFTLAVQG